MWNDRTLPTCAHRRQVVTRAGLGLALCLALPILQGCVPMLVGGVAIGASMVHDRRPATTVIEDEHLELTGMTLIYQDPEIRDHSRIAVTSYNHVVLLTGQADTVEISQRLATRMSQQPKVRRVVNEVTIEPPMSLTRESEDALITSRVKLALTGIRIPDFDLTRVKVVTEAGIVYLMGLVTSREAEAVAEKARYVPGVEKVIKVFEYIDSDTAPPA